MCMRYARESRELWTKAGGNLKELDSDHWLPFDQFRKALTANDEGRCTQVLQDALHREDKESFDASLALLFDSSPGLGRR